MLIHPDGLEVLGGTRRPNQSARPALGVGPEPTLRLYRRELTPATTVLLAFSSVREVVAADGLLAAAPEGAEAVLTCIYREVATASSFAAAALAWDDDAAAPQAPDLTVDRVAPAEVSAPQPSAAPSSAPPELLPGPAAPVAPAMSPSPFTTGAPQPPASLGLELRPPRRISSRRGRSLSISRTTGLLLITAVVALSLALLLWYFQAQAALSRESRAADLQAQAVALYEAALAAPNRAAMRQQLVQARAAAEAASAGPAAAPEAAALLHAVQERLTELDAAVPLAEPRVLVDLRQNAAGTPALRDPVLLGPALVVLDQGADQVYHLPPEAPAWPPEAPPTLPATRSASPRPLHRLLWMPQGGLWKRDTLLAFDESRALWEYNRENTTGGSGEGAWRRVPVRDAAGWAALTAAWGFGGNLYVLDAPANQAWRYVPTDTGFDSERAGALTAGDDLREAIDLAVDGDIYVLLGSGSVLKFSGGRLQAFPMDGLDRPLAGPVALFTGAGAQQVYVADNGNRRVVVFDKAGIFQRQILLPAGLPPLVDLLADEGRGLLYLVGERQVLVAPLPPGD